jgi:hypothetical protein
MLNPKQIHSVSTRREFLCRAGGGFGGLALAYLLGQDKALGAAGAILPSHAAKAKSVIFLFMEGGPSHIDLFDPKPVLQKLAGQKMPASFGRVITAMGTSNNTLLATKRKWAQHGKSGIWVSDWYPHIAKHADDLCVIRSCWADGLNHVGSICQMNTGSILAGRPSLGAWTSYGLGSANDNLPAFVVLADNGEVTGGAKNWGAGFLPAQFQGSMFRREGPPIIDLAPPRSVSEKQQRGKLDLLAKMNQSFDRQNPADGELDARLQSYELAYRMQAAAPEAVDIATESAETKELYGMNDPATEKVGANCLLARRLVERGVRFVEVYCSSNVGWDAHTDIEGNHTKNCRASDKPIAGLLTDLKQRGLLDETLIVWGGEFGRTPFNEKGNGRDHNPWGFTMCFAGGGSKAGTVVGATDEIGLRAVERRAHVNDIHATILHLMGLNHLDLTYLHNGRRERPTVNGGEVVMEAVA